VLVTCNDASEQAAFVAQRVQELCEEGEAMNRMAVLYRSHFHALELQLELTKRGMLFSITSGIRFFEQAHIKDVTAYVKLAANHRDELSFKRLAQLLPGIGGKGAEKLWKAFANAAGGVPSAESPPPLLALRLQACAGAVPKKAAVAWAQFVATVSQLEAKEIRDNASAMIGLVIEAGYEDYLEESYDNYRSRLDDLQQLAVFARQFHSVEDFLTQLALLTNVEAEAEQPASRDEERLRLSTIHQAKGLEFDVVFIIMLCDGMFPSERSMETPAGEEEERRLLYVAITRARNQLYLSYPLVRAGYGGSGDMMQQPSRFLAEIPEDLVDEWNLRPGIGGMG
jgi:DNA helicase-2/ATP-dependent DNA helicase PcrA